MGKCRKYGLIAYIFILNQNSKKLIRFFENHLKTILLHPLRSHDATYFTKGKWVASVVFS